MRIGVNFGGTIIKAALVKGSQVLRHAAASAGRGRAVQSRAPGPLTTAGAQRKSRAALAGRMRAFYPRRPLRLPGTP